MNKHLVKRAGWLIALTVGWLACTNHEGGKGAGFVPSTSPEGDPDTLAQNVHIFQGLYAKNRLTSGGFVDGLCDSSEWIFIPCGQRQGEKVSSGSIQFVSGGGCDELSAHQTLILQERKGVFPIVGSNIRVIDSAHGRVSARFTTAKGTRVVVMDKRLIYKLQPAGSMIATPK